MVYFIIFIIMILLLGSPQIKGALGEMAVKVYLLRLDKDRYKILNDVLLPTSSGGTSQIDHVIVSVYGIFVIETKNYKGWIVGDENSYQWTQIIYKVKNKFLNPIKQNEGHVKALKKLLKEYPHVPYHPIVTFSTNADLKVKVTSDVMYNPKLVRTIKKYTDEIISKGEMLKIYNTIRSANITDKEAKKEHVQVIREDVRARKDKIREDICPRCGGKLVNRNGKYGKFKGCSNYPKCRYLFKR